MGSGVFQQSLAAEATGSGGINLQRGGGSGSVSMRQTSSGTPSGRAGNIWPPPVLPGEAATDRPATGSASEAAARDRPATGSYSEAAASDRPATGSYSEAAASDR